MSKEVKFYIIIPIYNVEKYLKDCLDSVLNQTYKNFTAILINDGSTDNSPNIAKEYTKRDSRFILLEQENGGVGEARNTGLKKIIEMLLGGGWQEAESKDSNRDISPIPKDLDSTLESSYILFLDSDDSLEHVALEHIASIIKQHGYLECIFSNQSFHMANNSKIISREFFNKEYEDKVFCDNSHFLKNHIHLYVVWNTCFSAKFIFKHDLLFYPKIIYEDILFAQNAFALMSRFYIDSTPIYNYTLKREGSIMNVKNYFRSANSYFILASEFDRLSSVHKGYFSFWSEFYAKEVLRSLQFIGYNKKLDFSKQDLARFLVHIKGRRRFCYHFPRIYGFPKRLRLFLKSLFVR